MTREKAIEIVRMCCPKIANSKCDFETAMRVLIPELAVVESKDEKIRKEIIEYFYGCIRRNKKSGFRVEQIKGWIAYLEKQKDILEERAKNITTNMLEDGIGGIQRELIEFLSNTVNASWVDVIKSADAYAEMIRNIIEKQKEQKEQKPELYDMGRWDEESYNNGINHVLHNPGAYGLTKQKPAEWSEEDLQHKSWILECLADGERKMPEYAEDFRAAYNWLKFLRPQPKPEWSEEDKKMLEAIVGDIHCGANFNAEVIREANKREKWLRALRPQPHWKPSELQMFALDSAILMFHNLKRGGDKEELQSLYNDLKKL